MGLETGTRIQDLVPTNPVGATDFMSAGDDHIRLIKACLQGSFPSLGATAVALTADQINDAALKGATQTVSGAWTFSTAPTMAGTNISALNASNLSTGTVPDARFPATLPAVSAANLTNIPAGNLTGSIADARLSSNVPLKNAANTLTGALTLTVAANAAFSFSNGVNYTVEAGYTGASSDAYLRGTVGTALNLGGNNGNILRLYTGATIGSPTGGDKGAGSLNASALYVDGAAVAIRELNFRVFSGSDSSAATDAGRMVAYTGSGGHTFTLDSDLPANAVVTIINAGSGALTIACSVGTQYWMNGSGSMPTGNRTLAVGGVMTAFVSSGDARVWGVGVS